MKKSKGAIKKLQKSISVPFKGAKNAIELMRKGRLCAPYHAPYRICHEDSRYSLRRYIMNDNQSLPENEAPVLILIPPLMLTAEVYDMSPELSTVSFLMAQGIDVWVVDFGAPEKIYGAMTRTLDDHILAIDHAVSTTRQETGKSVHLAGYSQGGMFAYQCAAYRKNEDIASVITFGSPVNWYRNLLPKVLEPISSKIVSVGAKAALKPFELIGGVPAGLSSKVFKLISSKKEIKNIVHFFTMLHDRKAIEKIERKRRFLGGEGFVAWPGPALIRFIDDLVIQNRLLIGGLVINGRSVSLNDITCPIMYFVGKTDNFGRPAGVREIINAAPNAKLYEVELNCGHFGMVMGSKAFGMTWPTVANWLYWIEGQAGKPDFDPERPAAGDTEKAERWMVDILYNMATDTLDDLWSWLGGAGAEAMKIMDTLRWQLPRLAQVKQLSKNTRISMAKALKEQADVIPDNPFFLWRGQAYTYKAVDQRVDQIVAALAAQKVEPGDFVGLLMGNQPDFICVTVALNRMGAVSVLINPNLKGNLLKQAIQSGKIKKLVIDPEHIESAKTLKLKIPVMVCGSYRKKLPSQMTLLKLTTTRKNQTSSEEPNANAGMADDLAMILFTSGTTGFPKPVKISNRRWCAMALMTTAAGQITLRDTIYCCIPLHHGSGILAAAGSALIAGARLAIASQFSVNTFWNNIRRYGATVCFYVGQMCRYLINTPATEHDHKHAIRVFMGNGMHKDIWRKFETRFGIEKIIEFYSLTEGNANLVNLTGKKGSVGRPMDDPKRLRLVKYDEEKNEIVLDVYNRPILCNIDEKGVLIAKIDKSRPLGYFEGYLDPSETRKKIMNGLFDENDSWFNTEDLFYRDIDGDFWIVGRAGDSFCQGEEVVACENVAHVLSRLPFVAIAVTYGVLISKEKGEIGVAAIELVPGGRFDGTLTYKTICEHLRPPERPKVIRVVEKLPTTATLKCNKHKLVTDGIDPINFEDALYCLSQDAESYVEMVSVEVLFHLQK